MRGLTGDDAAADTLGDVQVTALVDILTSSTTAEIFASSTLPWPLEELSRRFPEDFQDDSWRFIVRCFLVQAGATAILVDAGAGPATTGMCQAMGIEGELLDRLGDLGVAEDEIDRVVVTHLHGDHVGWLTVPAQGGPRATFPRVRYHLHPADLDLAHDRGDSSRGRYWTTRSPHWRSAVNWTCTPAPRCWRPEWRSGTPRATTSVRTRLCPSVPIQTPLLVVEPPDDDAGVSTWSRLPCCPSSAQTADLRKVRDPSPRQC